MLVEPFWNLVPDDFWVRVSLASIPVGLLITVGIIFNIIYHSQGSGSIGFAFIGLSLFLLAMTSSYEVWFDYSVDSEYNRLVSYLWYFADFMVGLSSQASLAVVSTSQRQDKNSHISWLTIVPVLIGGPVLLATSSGAFRVSALVGLAVVALMAVRVVAINSENRQLNAKLSVLALSDHLTGIPNRRALIAEVEKRLSRGQLAVFFLDLDRFKEVNDSYGHEAGDQVIREVSRRLKNVVRPGDFVSRLGGDEFVVAVSNDNLSDNFISEFCERLKSIAQDEFQIEPRAAQIGVTIGVCRATPEMTAGEVLDKADQKMLAVKRQRKNRYLEPHRIAQPTL